MSSLRMRTMKLFAAACAAFCLCLAAEAHSVRIFAAQDGGKIAGKVYFVGGGVA